jgi:hypothetical protein
MKAVVLRERSAQAAVSLTLLGFSIWLIRPLLSLINNAAIVTPWTFYGGLACFALALGTLFTVIYLDETRLY